MSRLFSCQESVYAYYNNKDVHEIVRNKLTFDVEVESIYIIGDFGVQPREGKPVKDAVQRLWRTDGQWTLIDRPRTTHLEDVTSAGLWFYAGTVSLSQNFMIDSELWMRMERGERLWLEWDHCIAPAAGIRVNGTRVCEALWAPYTCDITDALQPGPNELTVEIITSCRNWLGPHHHASGDPKFVGPSSFTDQISWVDRGLIAKWTDHYHFVAYGIAGLRAGFVENAPES
jgi:hypothetical protein